jgi:hypothetical protein
MDAFKSPEKLQPGVNYPTAPDPTTTIRNQQTGNLQTAQQTQALNEPNQTSPFQYVRTVADPSAPSGFRIESGFSGSEAPVYEANTAARTGVGGVLPRAIGSVAGIAGTPFDVNKEAEAQRMALLNRQLAPIQEQERAALENRLANQGFDPRNKGPESGYQYAFDALNRKQAAETASALTSAGQYGLDVAKTARTEPFSELASLFGYVQPNTGGFVGQPNVNVAPTNVAGITQQGYENATQPALFNAQQQEQYRQAQLGALGSIFGTAAGGAARGYFSNPTPVNNMVKGWFS